MRYCSEQNCSSLTRTQGTEFCEKHYFANRRKLKLSAATSCSVVGCSSPEWNSQLNLCQKHYKQRWKKNRNCSDVETCSVSGCTSAHMAKSYCQSHYDKWQLHGDPLGGRQPLVIEDWGSCLAIKLSGDFGEGKYTLISHEDIDLVEGKSWWASEQGYVKCKRNSVHVLLHRLILGLESGDPREGDHINGETFDNRRENLRVVSSKQQSQNVKPWGKTGHRNVFFDEKKQLYRVIVVKDGKHHSGGRHKHLEEAIESARILRESLFTHHVEDRCGTPSTGEELAPG